ncbi:MAG TPA: tetratricopeptide repeat protein [Anaerolineaceae bacterium]|nr:tetratricopeptide repeat protein [Anaerolineaceae bacterium]
MESLSVYIPADRRLALARGVGLPERTVGAALFADISGFTALTEALVNFLGPQRGAEELPRWLNQIYDALIAEVDRYRGSVIGFSGDAITCWFDDRAGEEEPGESPTRSLLAAAGFRAAACAVAMQQTMRQFARVDIPGAGVISLAIKVVVAVGPVRRFLVGDPAIQVIDVLAGKTIYRLASGEHHAEKGEVLLDEQAVALLGNQVVVGEWRDDPESGTRFAVVSGLNVQVAESPWPLLPADALEQAAIQPWLLPPVYDRLMSGMGEFLTELRPTVALFLRFSGIDYDADPQAQSRLDDYVQAVQRVLVRYTSYMIQLTIGDKGSYFYASFGAPLAHEDDAVRAVSAALELLDLKMEFVSVIQIGISQGHTRTGAYGSLGRRTYGVLGDGVNTAARLMQNAALGQALVHEDVRKATADAFTWEELAPIRVKGKNQPAVVFRLVDRPAHLSIHLHEPKYSLPMVGRQAEFKQIVEKLDLALQGRGQIVAINAEAGMGKSRLVAEVIRLAGQRKVIGYGGECQSYGTNTSYLVWQTIWRDFFGLDPGSPKSDQIELLARQLARIDPALLPRLPLLGLVLNLQIPDNELTESFNAKLRKESLESLLVDCLRSRAREMPFLLVLEDCHWLDPLSHDLLEVIGRAAADLPVLILLTYRPPELERLLAPKVSQFFHFIEIPLNNLPDDETEQLVSFKAAQMYGTDVKLPPDLIEQICSRADGNPFYIEELLNYLHDRGIDPQQANALEHLDLPDSLHSLILSRIDQLSENQKTLIKVASVIGRWFRAAMLWGIYNKFGDEQQLLRDLAVLNELDLTLLDTPEPELAYLFKHIITQQVAYETLPYALRATFHDQIGQYIEKTYSGMLEQYIDLLAYHFDHSENLPKKREYLLHAGEAAQNAFSNLAAIQYYQRVLKLLEEDEQVEVLLKLGQVLELVGDWQAAEVIDHQAVALADRLVDMHRYALAQRSLGWLLRKRGEYWEAYTWMKRARDSYQLLGDLDGVSHVLADIGEIHRLQGKYAEARRYYDESLRLAAEVGVPQVRQKARAHALKGAGTVATWQGDYAAAREFNQESLAIRRELGDKPGVATLLNNLGIVARFQHDLEGARQMNAESLMLFREIGDRWAVGQLLNNQACVASDQGKYAEARRLLEESLFIRRQLGDKAGLALSLNTLADVILDEGDTAAARSLLDESLAINRELGDQTAIAYLLEDYGGLAAAEGRLEIALQLVGFAATLREANGAPLPPAEQARLNHMIEPAREGLPEPAAQAAWELGRSLNLEQAITLAVIS